MFRVSHLWVSLLALCAIGGAWPASSADVPAARESDLKAAFIYNFAKFTTWPAASFTSAQAPLVMGLIGNEEVATALEAQLKARLVAGHPIEVRKLTGPTVPADIHLIYIDARADEMLPALSATFARAGLLTIGDSETFMNRGGMIRFVVEAERLHFQINPAAAERAGLKLSSQLLMLAKRAQ